ncbi:tRNA methyltransferase complex GCD14 subunit [Dictyocaulus viviparus]|uniref:Vacuolar protein-sorting-associated protein 25 n=1 Tax=Dictyocaulus viviparus TaxID=29172 RepID=A0A0D8XMV7_DICVI|nr:tRNA methyltransferase complex GCD14 subunit [Dictyocaulus viviparus]
MLIIIFWFFRLQQTLVTKEKQLETWASLVIDYTQHNKIYTIDVAEAANSELFHNQKLNRRLSPEGIRAVFEYLEQKKHIEWLDIGKTRCHIYWRRPDEWAALIYGWAVSNGLLNTPCTLYEITHGDDTVQESFYGLEKDVLLKALRSLELQRRAQLMNIGTESEGVCFVAINNRVLFQSKLKWLMLLLNRPNQKVWKVLPLLLIVQMIILQCFDNDENAPSFFKYTELIEEGDTVIIYVTFDSTHAIVVRRGMTLCMKYGALRHEYIIGKPWGSRISATAGYVYALRPTAELWTRSLPRRTQILYTPDCSLILQLLDAKPGSVICESGTGSGSLSHTIAIAVAPTGHLYTHDIDESRTKKVEQEFKEHGLADVTTAVVQNVCTDGFFVANACDGVFLDVPAPWEAIPHAARAISLTRGGRLVSFSPCIEQVQRACEVMRQEGFVQVETVEIIHRTYKVVEVLKQSLSQFDTSGDSTNIQDARFTTDSCRKRKFDEGTLKTTAPWVSSGRPSAIVYPFCQPTHTGYLTHATMLPRE